jgi:hypothetical protein
MQNMCRPDKIVKPDTETKSYHDRKYAIYKELAEFQREIHAKMVED